jgi:hypothetical protein
MPDLGGFVRNVGSALRNPAVALDYGGWVRQRVVRADGPIRRIGGGRFGNFNSFSEYHSVAKNMSDAELAFLHRYSFRDGAIVDVGANLGLFSLVVRGRFPDRRVIAFEPAPSTFL